MHGGVKHFSTFSCAGTLGRTAQKAGTKTSTRRLRRRPPGLSDPSGFSLGGYRPGLAVADGFDRGGDAVGGKRLGDRLGPLLGEGLIGDVVGDGVGAPLDLDLRALTAARLVTEVDPELVVIEPWPPRTVEPETSDPLASRRAGLTVTPGWEVMERVRSGVKTPVDWVSRLRSVSEIMGIDGICPGSYVMCGV